MLVFQQTRYVSVEVGCRECYCEVGTRTLLPWNHHLRTVPAVCTSHKCKETGCDVRVIKYICIYVVCCVYFCWFDFMQNPQIWHECIFVLCNPGNLVWVRIKYFGHWWQQRTLLLDTWVECIWNVEACKGSWHPLNSRRGRRDFSLDIGSCHPELLPVSPK